MPSINLTNFENVVAHTISEINSTSGVTNIRNIYANQSDIIDLLNNKADQVDTYTKAQVDANFYDINQSYNKTEVNVLSNNISSNAYFIMNNTATIASNLVNVSSNTFLIGNLTITSNTNFNNISSNTHLINNLNSTITTNFNNISSNTNLINTNINNISSNTHLINNLNSTITSNFNNISSNSNLITGLNSTVNSHITAILDLQNENGGSFNESDYYNKITTNNLLSEKLNTSVLNNTLIHNITTTSTFKIANFGNYNNFYEMYNNYFDSYIYGNLSGATMFLNQRGFGDVEINNSSTFQNDKILLNHNTTILSNLQVSGLFSCSSILDIAGSDARYVLQSDGLNSLITGNTNTINSIITNDSAQDTVISQKLDKVNTTAQTVNSPLILSLTDNTNPIFRIQDAVSNQRLEFKRGCQLDSYQGLQGATPYRLWLGWNTGDVIIGRPNNASRITINGNIHTSYNFAQMHGTSYFEGAVYMKGNLFTNNDFSTDIKTKIDNINTSINGLEPYLETYTPDAIEGFYIHHPNFLACSIGDITNASNQYFMADGLVGKTIFSKPIDVLGNIYTNADVNCDNVNIATDGKLTIDTNCHLYRYVSAFSSFDMRNTDSDSSIRFICGDPAVQSNIVGAVNITSGWTFNTATADFMGNLFADDVYVKANGALRSNHLAPNGGTLITVDTNLAVQNAYLATNTIQSFDLTTVSFLDNISMTTGTDILMGTSEISTYYDGTNLSTIDVIFRTSNTAFRVSDSSTTPSVLLSIDKTFGTTVNTGSFTNNASSTFNENVKVAGTKKLLCNLIEPATGTNIDLTATTVTINGTFVDSSSALLKYDVDLIKSNCVNVIKKFKPKKFKRNDRNDNGAVHIGWIAEEVQKALPKDVSNVVSTSREYLGIDYTKVPVILHKALLEVIDKVEKLEKEIEKMKSK